VHVGDLWRLAGCHGRLLDVAGDLLGRGALSSTAAAMVEDTRQPLDRCEMSRIATILRRGLDAGNCWLISPGRFAVCSPASSLQKQRRRSRGRLLRHGGRLDRGVQRQQIGLAANGVISSTTVADRVAATESSLTRSVVVRAWLTASLAIRADSCTCRLISLTEETAPRGGRDRLHVAVASPKR